MSRRFIAAVKLLDGKSPLWNVTEWEDETLAINWIMVMFESNGDSEGQVQQAIDGSVMMFNSLGGPAIATLVSFPDVLS